MEMKDMLKPDQKKAFEELWNKSERVHSIKSKNKSKNGYKTNTRSSNIANKKSQAVTKTSQTVELYVIDNGTEICPIHKNHLKEKEYNLVNTTNPNGAALTIKALHCTLCNKNYVEERKQSALITQIKRGYPIKIKQYEDTKQQIERRIENYPVDIKLNTPIHILEEAGATHASIKCPVHGWDLEIYKMKRNYDNRSVGFIGFICQHCNRVYMRRSAAEVLLYECGEIGIPRPEFITNKRKSRDKYVETSVTKQPKYLVYDGKKVPYDFNLHSQVEGPVRIGGNTEILVSFSMNCDIEEHETEHYWCCVNVLEKSGIENPYIVKMGYCSTCERFFILFDDYNVIYQAGKAEAMIIDSTGKFDFVRAGSTFNDENEHLVKLQKDSDSYIDKMKKDYNYVGKYETSSDGYEDIVRLQQTKSRNQGLYDLFETIDEFSLRPYSNRVDIANGKMHKKYYIGVNDYSLPGYEYVISGWSDFGRQLSNYKALDIERDGDKYKVKLRRQFEIIGGRLYGYQNVFSEEEKHFKDGLTDPFLVKVLRTRQRQHRLTDILLTIQDRQYEIIEQNLHQNIIVQGCAGSGKTMVLLHRLSYLKYNHKDLDLNKILILTPNSNFNIHIQGLTEFLSLGKIDRKNIEDYYLDLLTQYNQEITEGNKVKILREENVRTEYVNYIYSDQFLEDMTKVYRDVISKYWASRWIVEEISRDADVDFDKNEQEPIYLKIEQLKKHTGKLLSLAESKEDAITRKIEEITKLEQELNDVQATINSNSEKIDIYTKRARENIPFVIDELINLRNEIINDNSKKSLLQRLRSIGSKNEEQVEQAISELTELEAIKDIDWLSVKNDQILETLKSLLPYREDLRKDISNLGRQLNQLKTDREKEKELRNIVDVETEALDRLLKENWSKDLHKRISDISVKIAEYTHSNIIKEIYYKATERARTEYSIRTTRNLYRFDLYGMLNIALWYYDNANGIHNYLCIDEGQDLSLNEFKLLKKLNNNKVVFNVYGDINQLLKAGRGISDWTAITKELKAKYFALNENYRNTNQITRYCNENFNMDVVLTGVEGKQVKEIQRHTLETEMGKLYPGDERIALLLPRSVNKDLYIDHERLPEHIRKVIGSVVGNGNIAVMYVDEVKGMEFDTVYVVSNGMTDNEKYIAFTRALTELIVVNDIDMNIKII